MFKSINESLDKMCTPSNRLQESKIRVVVDLGNRREYVPFDTEWAAKLRAQDYAKCKDVKKVDVIDNTTGEVIYSSENEKFDESVKNPQRKNLAESKSNMSKMLDKFDTAYEWMYDNTWFDDYDLMTMGEELMKSNPELLKEFVDFRGDLLTSDREVAAFACAAGYAGHVINIDDCVEKLRPKYKRAWEKGLITETEYKNAIYKIIYNMMKALNITDDEVQIGESLKTQSKSLHRKHRVK